MSVLGVIAGILLVLAGGVSGSFYMLYRARQIRLGEKAYGISTPYLKHIAGTVGAVTGLIIGGIILYFLALNQRSSLVEWVGRFSYVLITAASGGHVLTLVTVGLHLWREEQAWGRRNDPGSGTLGSRRVQAFRRLRRQYENYVDLKERDTIVLDE